MQSKSEIIMNSSMETLEEEYVDVKDYKMFYDEYEKEKDIFKDEYIGDTEKKVCIRVCNFIG